MGREITSNARACAARKAPTTKSPANTGWLGREAKGTEAILREWSSHLQPSATQKQEEFLEAPSQASIQEFRRPGIGLVFHHVRSSCTPEVSQAEHYHHRSNWHIDITNGHTGAVHTALHHIDVYQQWLRQETVQERTKVEWIPTVEQKADGLTNNLLTQLFSVLRETIDVRRAPLSSTDVYSREQVNHVYVVGTNLVSADEVADTQKRFKDGMEHTPPKQGNSPN